MILKKLVFVLFVLVILLYPGYVNSQDCNTPPPQGPPPDNADDNYSYNLGGNQSLNNSFYSGEYPFLGIFNKGNVESMESLLKKFMRGYLYVGKDFNPEVLTKNVDVLIVPTGGLIGTEMSYYFKNLLEQFVMNGGTIICFAQQDSDDYTLIPFVEEETLKAYGWRQDQSCYSGSVYFKGMHPVLSSASGELLSAVVDGYFEAWPSTSTVLLNRTKNREAAMLYYPYGAGYVILTSLYSDWAYAHSQATLMELRMVRDLITFAKNPHLPIPMFDLSENPKPPINLNVTIKNNTEAPVSKVKLKVYTPGWEKVLHEKEQAVNLAPGGEVEIPLQFTLPGLAGTEYGICHVDYELYDSDNNTVQLPTESDGGRFAVHNLSKIYTPSGGMDMWLTVTDEEVPHYEIPEYTLHIKNYTDTDQTVDFTYECNHRGSHPLFSVTVPANGRVDRPIILENEEPFQRLWLYSNTDKTISKGVNTIWVNANLQKFQYMVYLDFLTTANSDECFALDRCKHSLYFAYFSIGGLYIAKTKNKTSRKRERFG